MLPATRNSSTEAANKARKFYKEPKGFEKSKDGLTSFNHAVGPIAKYFLEQRIMRTPNLKVGLIADM
jgi:hypothetical protein